MRRLGQKLRAYGRVLPAAKRARLLERFTRAQVAELAANIAWENHRARLNRALGVRPAGFSEGATCALPERPVQR